MRHHFEGGHSVFELSTMEHHDHLVCNKCGLVEEFFDEVIEKQQDLLETATIQPADLRTADVTPKRRRRE